MAERATPANLARKAPRGSTSIARTWCANGNLTLDGTSQFPAFFYWQSRLQGKIYRLAKLILNSGEAVTAGENTEAERRQRQVRSYKHLLPSLPTKANWVAMADKCARPCSSAMPPSVGRLGTRACAAPSYNWYVPGEMVGAELNSCRG